MLHILEAYTGEIERNDYRRLLSGRATTNAVLGSERVFGFGSPAASALPYAEVLTEVRRMDGRWMAAGAHHLDEGPLPEELFGLDLTAWVESPSVHQTRRPHPRGPRRGRAPASPPRAQTEPGRWQGAIDQDRFTAAEAAQIFGRQEPSRPRARGG